MSSSSNNNSSVDPMDKYRNPQRVSLAQKATGLVRENWVITSLIVAILSIALYGLLSSSISVPPITPGGGNSQDDSDSSQQKGASQDAIDAQNPPYWTNEFDKSGHFTNFTQVMLTELERNFKGLNDEAFILNVPDEILDKQNWRSLFNFTEQIVKGIKLISLQDDVLKNKRNEFESAQAQFAACQEELLESNRVMEHESQDLISANRTIAHQEGMLETLRDELSYFQQSRQIEVNKTNIQISQKIMERNQQGSILEQTLDKDQYLKELLRQQDAAAQRIEEVSVQIELLRSKQKQADFTQIKNEDLSKQYQDEINQVQFDIDRIELNSEINSIVGRVSQEEHINNTKQLTLIIQKRIKLINAHKAHGNKAISDELMRTFEHDKAQLKDLNNLQINLIRSFRQKAKSDATEKTLQELRQELEEKKLQLEEVKQKVDNKDAISSDFSERIQILESSVTIYSDEVEVVQRKIKDLEANYDSEGELNPEAIKAKIMQLDEDIEVLKIHRTEGDQQFLNQVKELLEGIAKQKLEIQENRQRFGSQIGKRLQLERGILKSINNCRTFRFMMGTIEASANESLEKVRVTKQKLHQIKSLLTHIMNRMVPGSKLTQAISEQDLIDEIDLETRNIIAQEIAAVETDSLIE